MRRFLLLSLLLVACDLQPLNRDTGTLEKLRVVHFALDDHFFAAHVHIVDKAPNDKAIRVRVGACVVNKCPVTTKIEDVLIDEQIATRIHESLWELTLDLTPYRDLVNGFDGGRALLIEASDGEQSDLAYVPMSDNLTSVTSAFAIQVLDADEILLDEATPLAARATYTMQMDPPADVRWYVSANAAIDERKAPRTTLDLVRALPGDLVHIYAVSNSGHGAFVFATFVVGDQ